MIILDEKNRVFTLHTHGTTYQMKADRHDVLVHTYYGPRVSGGDLSYLIQYADRGFSPNPSGAGRDRTYSLDTTPQEYSTCGVGDFRLPSLELELEDGSLLCDLRYTGHRLEKGKYSLPGLPAFFGGEEWETLAVTLSDAAAQVEVELLYGVLAERDLITRAARITNRGSRKLRLRQAASLCLDFHGGDRDHDLITFNGCHAMERCLDRSPLRPGIQSVYLVAVLTSGAYDDNGHIGPSPDSLYDFHPVHVRQSQIQQDHIRVVGGCLHDGCLSVGRHGKAVVMGF